MSFNPGDVVTVDFPGVILSIPVHSNRDLPSGTLKSLLKDAGLTEENLE